MMRFLNAKARITLGLVGIIVSLILMAFFLKIIPDKYSADVARRTVLAETITVYSTALVKTTKVQRLKDDFKLLAERNKDLLSLALRHNDGNLLVATADHAERWEKMSGEHSSIAQVKVPIWAGNKKWGQLELRFSPLIEPGIWGLLRNPMVQAVLFVGCACFVIFYFYLGRVLRQLDPSQAIPGRVRSALDTMAEGLLILDRKEQIVLANQAFSSMVEMSADKLLGYRAGELPWSDSEGNKLAVAKRPWVAALAQGEVRRNSTVRLQLPDASYRTFKTNCSPVLGDKGKYAGVLISFDDITELEQKELELINSKQEAEEANKAKSSFLANMSHEIRTPMNAILGFTEILKRGYVKNEQDSLKYLNTIHSSGKNLLELINDILDLSKVESGALEVEKVKVKPYPIIHEVIQMLQVRAEEKGIALGFNVTVELPEEIETDAIRLRQIAFNLIGNSIKFTDTGGVEVSCRLAGDSAESQLIIDIKDTGIGMTEEAQQKIFDPFTQADNSISRRFGGTGLGLAISQRFAQALGGGIRVQSKLGQGSTFSVALTTGALDGVKFLLPEEINQQQQEPESAADARWQFPPAKVLVVDDGNENRELIKLLLGDVGLTVEEAENGQLGVEKAIETAYDVILMDVNMPVMDGYLATKALRAKGLIMPIVALTANAMQGDEENCLAAGYSDYCSKPINIDQFMDLMAKLLGGRRAEAELSTLSTEIKAAEPVEDVQPQVENAPIYSTLPVSKEKFRKIVVRFVDRLSDLLDQMDKAAVNGNYAELADLAHSLKGSGGTVGFEVFTEPSQELEDHAKEQNRELAEKTIKQLRSLAARIVVTGDADSASLGKETVVTEAILATDSPRPLNTQPDAQKPIVSRLANNERMHRIIHTFIETLETKLQQMEVALQAEDFSELANLAHWLRGAGGTVGYDEFTTPAETLENFAKGHQLLPATRIFKDIQRLSQALVAPEVTIVNPQQKAQ